MEDPGFWYMHASIGDRILFSKWQDFLELHSHQIHKVRSEKNYAIIDLTWTLRDSSTARSQQPKAMRFYVVQENGRWVFINPIDLLTRD
ncbi:MAG: hypothetical protein ACE5I5_15275, partial [Candidatus Heimdallarchaeota archaeon]